MGIMVNFFRSENLLLAGCFLGLPSDILFIGGTTPSHLVSLTHGHALSPLGLLLGNIDMYIGNSLVLTGQQYTNLIINKLKLPGHFLIDIINLIHGAYGTMDVLEI